MELLGAVRPAYTMSGEETLAALDALHAEAATRKTYELQLMARLDETGYAKELSGLDTARFLATRHRLNKPEVQRNLKLALALPKYPVVAAALPDPHAPAGPDPTIQYTDKDAGDGTDPGVLPVLLHPDQAEAIVSSLEAVRAAAMVPVENLLAAETQMVEAARHFSSWDLKKLGRQVRDILDTDGPEPAEDAARRRESLRLTNADHGVKFSGFLAAENAELLKTAIEAGAAPRPTLDGRPDPRSRDQRQAGALSDVLALAANAEELPAHGGVKPHITVTMDLTDLVEAGRNATGDLQFGDGLSASAVRRLACDAGVIPIVLGAESEPLDVGREQRYVTKAMRRALNQRDGGCVICGMPPRYCHAHHIVSWLDGGPTSLTNLALVCGRDHIAVHAGHYTITITNGRAHVTRPTWATPPRTTPTSSANPPWATTPRSTGAQSTPSTTPPTTGADTTRSTSAPPTTPATTAATTGPDPGASTTRSTNAPPPTSVSGERAVRSTGVPPATSATGERAVRSTGAPPATPAGGVPTARSGAPATSGPDAGEPAHALDKPRLGAPARHPGTADKGLRGSDVTSGSGTAVAAAVSSGDGSGSSDNATGERTGLIDPTGTDNDPYWGQGPPSDSPIDGGLVDPATLRPARAFPLVGDPPPLTASRPADFDPWGPEVLDTG